MWDGKGEACYGEAHCGMVEVKHTMEKDPLLVFVAVLPTAES